MNGINNNVELKSHLDETTEIDTPIDEKPDDTPGLKPRDVTVIRHTSDSSSCIAKNIGESAYLDSRSLNSVLEYTSKIRAFIGLSDDLKSDCSPGSSLEAVVHTSNASDNQIDIPLESEENLKESLSNVNSGLPSADENKTDIPLNEINEIPESAEVDARVLSNVKENIPELVSNKNIELRELLGKNDSVSSNSMNLFEETKSILESSENASYDLLNVEEEYIESLAEEDNSLAKLNEEVSQFSGLEQKKNCVSVVSIPNSSNNSCTSNENIDRNTVISKDNANEGESYSNILNNNLLDHLGHTHIQNAYNCDMENIPDKTNDFNSISEPNCSQSNAHEINKSVDFPQVNENLDFNTCVNMSEGIPEENLNSQLIENEKAHDDGIILNDPKTILNDEVGNRSEDVSKDLNKISKDLNSSPDDVALWTNSLDSCEDKYFTDSDGKEKGRILNLSEGEVSDESKGMLSNGAEDKIQDHLENKKIPEPEDIETIPYMANLRRLSAEIVSQVLDTAESHLRDILEEEQKPSLDSNGSFSNVVTSDINKAEGNYLVKRVTNGTSQGNEKNEISKNENDSYQMIEKCSQKATNNKLNNEIQLKDVLAKTYDSHDFQRKIELEMNKFDPRYDVDTDTICGIGNFKPLWLQKWATARVYLILYSIIGILSGSYYSYLIGTISTLEKRFAFESKISGSIMMLDEITPLLLGVLIGYFGGKVHRPRMVGFSMLLSATCCFVTALPYFIYGPATHLSIAVNMDNTTDYEMCDSEIRIEHCDSDDLPPTLAAILFLMLGSFLKGFGNLAYYAVGLAYMDDNAKKKNTPMYFAVAFALRLLGPLVGFLMSSAFLKYNENPFDDPGFGQEDPRWIGGWWMGFVLQGVLLTIFAVPILLFPRRLPGSKRPSSRSKGDEGNSLRSNMAGLFAAVKRLGKNPLFIFIVLNTIMSVFGSFGHYILLPKYMENQFRLSASDASLLSGPPALAAIIVSTLVGGYLIYRFKPNAKVLTAGLVCSETINAVGFLLLMIPQCENMEMSNFGLASEGLILEDNCNANCNCSTTAFTPVCGPDGNTFFFSPCYAGCQQNMNETFTNCSCVVDPSGQQRDYVTEGFCVTEGCWSQALAYMVALAILYAVTSFLRVAHTMVLLRSIQSEDKSVALGTFETFISAFGFIPYPVLFGSLVDSACLVWEKSCGQTGNCWFYDVDKFNYLLHGASAGFSALSAGFLFVVFFLSGRVNDLYEEDEVNDIVTKQKETESQSEETNVVTKL